MADSRFFKKTRGSFSVAELAKLTKSNVIGDGELEIFDLATLTIAKKGELSFFSNPKYRNDFSNTKASTCICDEAAKDYAPAGVTLLINPNPYFAYAIVTNAFYGCAPHAGNISQNSVIDDTASISAGVHISDFAVIGKNVKIGENSFVGHNVTICDGVEIGKNTKIMNNVTISHSIIGDNCTLFSGSRIGQDGFGYAPSTQGIIKVEQLGRVIIGNNVDIGANTTVDRGALEDTIIGDGTKIDNLVQIGHNVKIGRNCFIAAQTGIAGSTNVGDGVMLGGQVGISGHVNIGNKVMAAAQSGIISDIQDGITVGGYPALPIMQWHRITAMMKKMILKGRKDK